MKFQYIFGLILIFGSVYFLFDITHKTHLVRDQIHVIDKEIINNKNNIHILKAEWSYLTNPERIKKLADKHLSARLQVAQQVRRQETQLVFNKDKLSRNIN